MTTDPRPDLRALIETLDSYPGWSMRPPNARRWVDRDEVLALIPPGSVLVTRETLDGLLAEVHRRYHFDAPADACNECRSLAEPRALYRCRISGRNVYGCECPRPDAALTPDPTDD
jgi:hypothetical protein